MPIHFNRCEAPGCHGRTVGGYTWCSRDHTPQPPKTPKPLTVPAMPEEED